MQKAVHFRVDPKLTRDYGREPSFVILVNGERVFQHDIQRETFQTEITLPNGQTASVAYTIADKPCPAKNQDSTSALAARVSANHISSASKTPRLFHPVSFDLTDLVQHSARSPHINYSLPLL